MFVEAAIVKTAGLTSGVVLVLAGAFERGTSILTALGVEQAQGDSIAAIVERAAPNVALGSLGMWLIYRVAVVYIDKSADRTEKAIEVLGDRLVEAFGTTVDEHRELGVAARQSNENDLREIRQHLSKIEGQSR